LYLSFNVDSASSANVVEKFESGGPEAADHLSIVFSNSISYSHMESHDIVDGVNPRGIVK